MDVRLPDGTLVRNVPDGTTKAELVAKLKAGGHDTSGMEPAKPSPTYQQRAQNLAAGGLRGAGSIGATLLTPIDAAARHFGVQNDLIGRTDRREAMTEALKGLGVETDSLEFGVGKLGTEIAGTAGVGGLLAKLPLISRFPALVEALTSSGMRAGGAQGIPGMATRVAGGAAAGGGAAALVNPENALIGAAVGGAMPPATKTLGLLGKAVTGPVHAARVAAFESAARESAKRKIVEALGEKNVPQAIDDLQAAITPQVTAQVAGATIAPQATSPVAGAATAIAPQATIPLSSAAITGNPALASLEQGSRLRMSPDWYGFDQKQGRAVFDNLMAATKEADEIASRAVQRRGNWQQAWGDAQSAAVPQVFAQKMGALAPNIEQALMSPEASNPAVRNVLEAIKGEIARVGPGFSPAHLQQIRANLSGRYNPISPNVFASAPRDSPAVRSIITEIDDILNASTGGAWQKVIKGYAQDSQKLHQAKAASKVRGSFIDPDTGRVRGVALDADVPKITEAGLGRAMDAARLPDKSLALSSQADQRLNATREALRRQAIVQAVKRSGSAGGGSDTAGNLLAMGAGAAIPKSNILVQVIQGLKEIGTEKSERQLAGLLSDPQELARLLSTPGHQGGLLEFLEQSAYRGAPLSGGDR